MSFRRLGDPFSSRYSRLGSGSRGKGAVFAPTDIAGLLLWLDADVGLFTDAAATIPVTADGDVVGTWQDQSGNGNDFSQTTASKKPEFKTSQINSKDVVRFDGIDNLLTAPNFSSVLEGSIFVTYQLTAALADFSNLLSTSDEASDTEFFLARPFDFAVNPNLIIANRRGVPEDKVKGDTIIVAATVYLSTFRSNNIAYTMRVNGNDETIGILTGANTGSWFGDISARDNFTVGALKRLAEVGFLKGDIRQMLVYDTNIAGADLSNVENFLALDAGVTLP